MEGIREHSRRDETLRVSSVLGVAGQRAFFYSIVGLLCAIGFTIALLALLTELEGKLIATLLGFILTALAGSLLTIGLVVDQRSKDLSRAMGLGRDRSPLRSSAPPLLENKKLNLRGRPDGILPGNIPVEMKTGKTPTSPHQSNVMQLAVYLRLLQGKDGSKPTHGLLVYPDKTFHIENTDHLQENLDAILSNIKDAEDSGVANRDHDDLFRCNFCARRSFCDQKISA